MVRFIDEIKELRYIIFLIIWLGALTGKLLELGLLKISWGECFFLFIAPAGPYHNPFTNHAGQS